MAKKYIKNEKGIVKSITTDNLQLEKPLLNENYDIEVHNRNMDKIDNAIQEVKGQVSGLELTAQRVSIADPTNKFEATNVEDALLENKTSILNNTNLANQALSKANEAFQRGDNVKSQLVDKLISEGLDVSTDNTFEELIGNIALGKKWASGTYVSNAGSTKLTLNLDFNPRLVFINFDYADGTNSRFNRFTIYFKDINETTSTSVVTGYSHDTYNVTLKENGIDIYAYGYSKPNTFYWYAFE